MSGTQTEVGDREDRGCSGVSAEVQHGLLISNVNDIKTKQNKVSILAFLYIEVKQTLLIPKF